MVKQEQFKQERTRLNAIMAKYANIDTKKFLHLDSAVYENGHLSNKTKELLGLVASLVLRCDDCIIFHLNNCLALEVTVEEIVEALNIGLIVGGSITIPHIRRALDILDEEASKEMKTP